MSTRGGARRDAGAVLVFVVLLMLALVGLGHGLLVTALAELATSRAGARHLRARTAADAAVSEILRTPGGAWSGAVGLPADLPPGPPRFLAYSITKSFLAVLVLQLRDEGRYELDDSLARFAPDVPEAERVTLRQLLNHTAGLPDYGALPAYHAAIRERPGQPLDLSRLPGPFDPFEGDEPAAHLAVPPIGGR